MDRIKNICEKYNLGNLVTLPEAVTGGLLHKMYHARTERGEYAIKVLNPSIMKRPEALQNTVNSELVSNALAKVVPVVAAKCFEGKYVIEFEDSFYMIFDWLEGESVFAPNISEYHCKQIGRILGKIHAADSKVDCIERDSGSRTNYDWAGLLEKAEQRNPECYSVLRESIDDLIRWDEHVVRGMPQVKQTQVISHRDLDPKNVMWKNDAPYLIDWEAAGYVNPFQELIEVLNYWISDETGSYSKAKFDALLQAYTENISIDNVNWDIVLDCSFDGMLGWLEYNVKRALGLEGNDADDLQEGIQQIKGTLFELRRYESQTEQLKEWINTIYSDMRGKQQRWG